VAVEQARRADDQPIPGGQQSGNDSSSCPHNVCRLVSLSDRQPTTNPC
jgi:hypothetical protein